MKALILIIVIFALYIVQNDLLYPVKFFDATKQQPPRDENWKRDHYKSEYRSCIHSCKDDFEKRRNFRPGLLSHKQDPIYAECLKKCKQQFQ